MELPTPNGHQAEMPEVRAQAPVAPSAPCVGCTARDSEIRWLRSRLEAQDDRLLAAVAPGAHAQLHGQPGVPAAAIESWVSPEDGQAYVTVAGKAVKIEDWQEMLKKAGSVVVGGQVVSDEEYRSANEVLDKMVGGGRS